MSDLTVERYRLTLTHELIVDGKEVGVEEPKVYEIMNCDYNDRGEVAGYKNHILDELFYRFRQELKKEESSKWLETDYIFDMAKALNVAGYKKHILDELFYRFRQELKKEESK